MRFMPSKLDAYPYLVSNDRIIWKYLFNFKCIVEYALMGYYSSDGKALKADIVIHSRWKIAMASSMKNTILIEIHTYL